MSVCQSSGHRLREHCRAGVGRRTPPVGCVVRFLPVGLPRAPCPPSDFSKGEGDWIQLVSHPQGKNPYSGQMLLPLLRIFWWIISTESVFFFPNCILFFYSVQFIQMMHVCYVVFSPGASRQFESGWKAWVFLLIPLSNGIAHQNLNFKKKNFSESERVCMRYRTC